MRFLPRPAGAQRSRLDQAGRPGNAAMPALRGTQHMSTRDIIAPILHATYGKGSMVAALADHVAKKIDTYSPTARGYDNEAEREGMICMVCWDWMTGGGTASRVAAKIETALQKAGK